MAPKKAPKAPPPPKRTLDDVEAEFGPKATAWETYQAESSAELSSLTLTSHDQAMRIEQLESWLTRETKMLQVEQQHQDKTLTKFQAEVEALRADRSGMLLELDDCTARIDAAINLLKEKTHQLESLESDRDQKLRIMDESDKWTGSHSRYVRAMEEAITKEQLLSTSNARVLRDLTPDDFKQVAEALVLFGDKRRSAEKHSDRLNIVLVDGSGQVPLCNSAVSAFRAAAEEVLSTPLKVVAPSTKSNLIAAQQSARGLMARRNALVERLEKVVYGPTLDFQESATYVQGSRVINGTVFAGSVARRETGGVSLLLPVAIGMDEQITIPLNDLYSSSVRRTPFANRFLLVDCPTVKQESDQEGSSEAFAMFASPLLNHPLVFKYTDTGRDLGEHLMLSTFTDIIIEHQAAVAPNWPLDIRSVAYALEERLLSHHPLTPLLRLTPRSPHLWSLFNLPDGSSDWRINVAQYLSTDDQPTFPPIGTAIASLDVSTAFQQHERLTNGHRKGALSWIDENGVLIGFSDGNAASKLSVGVAQEVSSVTHPISDVELDSALLAEVLSRRFREALRREWLLVVARSTFKADTHAPTSPSPEPVWEVQINGFQQCIVEFAARYAFGGDVSPRRDEFILEEVKELLERSYYKALPVEDNSVEAICYAATVRRKEDNQLQLKLRLVGGLAHVALIPRVLDDFVDRARARDIMIEIEQQGAKLGYTATITVRNAGESDAHALHPFLLMRRICRWSQGALSDAGIIPFFRLLSASPSTAPFPNDKLSSVLSASLPLLNDFTDEDILQLGASFQALLIAVGPWNSTSTDREVSQILRKLRMVYLRQNVSLVLYDVSSHRVAASNDGCAPDDNYSTSTTPGLPGSTKGLPPSVIFHLNTSTENDPFSIVGVELQPKAPVATGQLPGVFVPSVAIKLVEGTSSTAVSAVVNEVAQVVMPPVEP